MKNAYIYPRSQYAQKDVHNPYLTNLMNSLEKYYHFINREKPSDIGIFDLFRYYRKIDCVFFNWIEDLPDKRGGWIQGFFFIILIYILKRRKIKIIWTLHNKLSHYKSNFRFKQFLFKFLLVHSDCILTHAREGVQYAYQYKLKDYNKIKYFPHPIEKKIIRFNDDPLYDILIWGSIIPYKNIDKFLQYLYDNNLQNNYKIQIVGKIKPDSYKDQILKLCNNNIQIDNRFIPEEELKTYIDDSKIVLFTYAGDSVLSSGVLMDTLSYGAKVLAPHVGAFKDAEEDGLIRTFQTYDDLIPLIDISLKSPLHTNNEVISKFIEKSNWQQFSMNIVEWLN